MKFSQLAIGVIAVWSWSVAASKDDALILAAFKNDMTAIEYYLEAGADANHREGEAMMQAAFNRNVQAVDLMLKTNGKVDTLIHRAEHFLNYRGKLVSSPRRHRDIDAMVMEKVDEEINRPGSPSFALIDFEEYPSDTRKAMKIGSALWAWVAHGGDGYYLAFWDQKQPHSFSEFSSYDRSTWNQYGKKYDSLKMAALMNDYPCVKFLLESGDNVHDRNDEPLVQATFNRNAEMVKLLLSHGARVGALQERLNLPVTDNPSSLDEAVHVALDLGSELWQQFDRKSDGYYTAFWRSRQFRSGPDTFWTQ